MTLSTVYKLAIDFEDVMKILRKYSLGSNQLQSNNKKYVFIIDEINRGNISKILGELITLIEESKRFRLRPDIKLTEW